MGLPQHWRRLPERHFRVCSLTAVAWVVRLVKAGSAVRSSASTSCRSSAATISALSPIWATGHARTVAILPDGKWLPTALRHEIVAAQARGHAVRWPGYGGIGAGMNGHRIADRHQSRISVETLLLTPTTDWVAADVLRKCSRSMPEDFQTLRRHTLKIGDGDRGLPPSLEAVPHPRGRPDGLVHGRQHKWRSDVFPGAEGIALSTRTSICQPEVKS